MARMTLWGTGRRPIRRAISLGRSRQPAWVRRAWEITQEWYANHGRKWVSCEDVARHVVQQLRAEGFEIGYATGNAAYHDADADEDVVDFHAWCQIRRQVFDPKAQILKSRGFPNWRYWDYQPDAVTTGNEDES